MRLDKACSITEPEIQRKQCSLVLVQMCSNGLLSLITQRVNVPYKTPEVQLSTGTTSQDLPAESSAVHTEKSSLWTQRVYTRACKVIFPFPIIRARRTRKDLNPGLRSFLTLDFHLNNCPSFLKMKTTSIEICFCSSFVLSPCLNLSCLSEGIPKTALCKRKEIQGTILTQLFCSLLPYFCIVGQTLVSQPSKCLPAQPLAAITEESKFQEDSSWDGLANE